MFEKFCFMKNKDSGAASLFHEFENGLNRYIDWGTFPVGRRKTGDNLLIEELGEQRTAQGDKESAFAHTRKSRNPVGRVSAARGVSGTDIARA